MSAFGFRLRYPAIYYTGCSPPLKNNNNNNKNPKNPNDFQHYRSGTSLLFHRVLLVMFLFVCLSKKVQNFYWNLPLLLTMNLDKLNSLNKSEADSNQENMPAKQPKMAPYIIALPVRRTQNMERIMGSTDEPIRTPMK